MSQIIVSASELTKKKEALERLKDTFKSQIDQLETASKKLDTMWEGEAKKKYRAAMDIDIDKLKVFLKIVLEFIQVLMTIISLYNQMEKRNISLASS